MEKKFTVRSFVESLSRPRARSLFPTYQAPRKPAWHYNPPFPPSFLPALLTCTSLVPPPPPLLLLLCPSTQEPSLLTLAKVVAAAASLRKCLEHVVLAFPVGMPGIMGPPDALPGILVVVEKPAVVGAALAVVVAAAAAAVVEGVTAPPAAGGGVAPAAAAAPAT